jgi:hypothetical protein
MGAGWVSELEGWVAGASKSGVLVGLFFKTSDGGYTWTLEQVCHHDIMSLLVTKYRFNPIYL